MSGRHTTDEASVRARLRATAQEHEPDVGRILALTRSGTNTPTSASSGWTRPALVSAAVASVAVVAVFALRPSPAEAPVAAPTTAQAPTGGASSTSVSPTPAPPAPAPPPLPGPSIPAPAPSPPAAPVPSPGGEPAPAPVPPEPEVSPAPSSVSADVSVEPVDDTTVTLPMDGARDWLVTGDRPKGRKVRQADGPGRLDGPNVIGGGTGEVVRGPFQVRWGGGEPARDGDHRTWFTVAGSEGSTPQGLTVTATPGAEDSELVLYVGAERDDARLQVLVGDRTIGAEVLERRSGAGYVVTVRLTGVSEGNGVTVRMVAGKRGSVAVAAAVLR